MDMIQDGRGSSKSSSRLHARLIRLFDFLFNGRVFDSHSTSSFGSDHGPDRLNLIPRASLREDLGQEAHLGVSLLALTLTRSREAMDSCFKYTAPVAKTCAIKIDEMKRELTNSHNRRPMALKPVEICSL